MKIEFRLQNLRNAISLIERIAGKHMTLPVLSCLLIQTQKNTVTIKATNLDIGAEITIPAKSETDVTVAVPSSVISSFLSQINEPDGVINLENVSGNVQITSAKSKGTIKTIPNDDFPSIPKVSDDNVFVLNSSIFAKGLKSVWYSASVSSVKPELSSVYVYQNQQNEIVFVATDSFRLAEKKIKVQNDNKIGDILIPFKNIPDIVRILEAINGDINVRISKNLISFENKEIYLVSRVIDGTFPDYKQIIPKNYVTEVVVLKQDMVNALKISNIFSDKFNQIRFVIDPKKKTFEINTKNNDIGENKTHIDATVSGEATEINFNYKYIVDCFQSIDSDSVSLELGGVGRPMIIKPISSEQSFLYLVMPMNR